MLQGAQLASNRSVAATQLIQKDGFIPDTCQKKADAMRRLLDNSFSSPLTP